MYTGMIDFTDIKMLDVEKMSSIVYDVRIVQWSLGKTFDLEYKFICFRGSCF